MKHKKHESILPLDDRILSAVSQRRDLVRIECLLDDIKKIIDQINHLTYYVRYPEVYILNCDLKKNGPRLKRLEKLLYIKTNYLARFIHGAYTC